MKASIIVGVELHARWAAAAALRGMDRSAFAAEAISDACKGLVLIDRRKSSDHSRTEVSADPADSVNPAGEVQAAAG